YRRRGFPTTKPHRLSGGNLINCRTESRRNNKSNHGSTKDQYDIHPRQCSVLLRLIGDLQVTSSTEERNLIRLPRVFGSISPSKNSSGSSAGIPSVEAAAEAAAATA